MHLSNAQSTPFYLAPSRRTTLLFLAIGVICLAINSVVC